MSTHSLTRGGVVHGLVVELLQRLQLGGVRLRVRPDPRAFVCLVASITHPVVPRGVQGQFNQGIKVRFN